ncbi:hypothetical protein [Prevotella sp. P6B1]|uniref:hypothetical protein n=1 Tax=Prevotella sp. P6B1 TaxID=1410613 RepID=UPI00051B4E4A|nr:hypothetical protein [Prevotella sp. P6B1]
MEIIINGKLACLKKNTSFEYIVENPLFTGSDSYTLTITFPLKDCPENIDIFGHLYRQDVEKNKVIFDCEIRDKQFYKAGCITVTQISDTEVKTQFLEGRSEQNFNDSFDNIYINQLDLGYADDFNPNDYDPSDIWAGDYPTADYVALPWVNNTSGNIQNEVKKDIYGHFQWASGVSRLSFQPYLLYILKKICSCLRYTGSFSAINNSYWKHLIICNNLPAAWSISNFASALPHWTLTEFFEQLELLMGGEFTINHKARTIKFQFSHKIAFDTDPVMIDRVINKYTVDVSQEDKSEYIATRNLAYADNDNRLWVYRCCQWFVNKYKDEAKVYNKLSDLLRDAALLKESGIYISDDGRGYTTKHYYRGYPVGSDGNKLFYAKDVDTYFIMYCYKAELYDTTHVKLNDTDYHWYKYYNRLMPINQFGNYIYDKKADDVELNIVPAWIDDTEEELGPCLFLECGEMGSAESWSNESNSEGTITNEDGSRMGGQRTRAAIEDSNSGRRGDDTDYNDGALAQGRAGKTIEQGEQEKNEAYFDKIYVGFWDGIIRKTGKLPRPMVDTVEVDDDFTSFTTSYSLRINKKKGNDAEGIPYNYTYNIDNRKKYSFSFLTDEIPNPRALYIIEGGQYICEKITATFHESTGKSQLLRGNFYRVVT